MLQEQVSILKKQVKTGRVRVCVVNHAAGTGEHAEEADENWRHQGFEHVEEADERINRIWILNDRDNADLIAAR